MNLSGPILTVPSGLVRSTTDTKFVVAFDRVSHGNGPLANDYALSTVILADSIDITILVGWNGRVPFVVAVVVECGKVRVGQLRGGITGAPGVALEKR